MAATCPLCCVSNTSLVETFAFTQLRRLYRKQMKLDLGHRDLSAIDLRRCDACDLRFYDPVFSGDEEFYGALQKADWYYLSEKQEYDFAAQYISSEDRVLELGAGRGAFAAKVRPRSYVGLELSAAAASQARQRGIEVYKHSVEEHAKEHAGNYDVVCSFQVLEHIPDPRNFIESSLKCLKSGGKLIFSVPREDGFLGRQSNNALNMPPHHSTRWSDTALRAIAGLFHLQIVAFGYDMLSDLHVRSYSVGLIQNGLNNLLHRRQRSMDALFDSVVVKAPIRLCSLFLEKSLQDRALRPAGHSVTVVYRKP
jgi:SAM-dependent methyltransferase